MWDRNPWVAAGVIVALMALMFLFVVLFDRP